MDGPKPVRDDFTPAVKLHLAKRAGVRCSNPNCRRPTSGPQAHETGAVNIGEAAHITAAAPEGPRYDPNLTAEERQDAANGIWLCGICSKSIDRDLSQYTTAVLRDWKQIAEAAAFLEQRGYKVGPDRRALLKKLEEDMPELFTEMRDDLSNSLFGREFVLLSRNCSYNCDPNNPILSYHFEKHAHLQQKIKMLENNNLVRHIPGGNVDRFVMFEELVDYLRS